LIAFPPTANANEHPVIRRNREISPKVGKRKEPRAIDLSTGKTEVPGLFGHSDGHTFLAKGRGRPGDGFP